MRRRSFVHTLAIGLASTPLLAACAAPASAKPAPRDALVLAPARQLALTLADLPGGFRLAEELAPTFSTTGLEDPYGRLSSFSATYALGGKDDGDVVSSINSYATPGHAQAAFESWQAAIPRQYRTISLEQAPKDVRLMAYARDGACLVGARTRNVLASVLVQHGKRDDHAGSTPPDEALALMRRMLARIEAAAGK